MKIEKKKKKTTVSTTPTNENPTQTIKIAAIKQRNSREENKKLTSKGLSNFSCN